MDKIEKYENFEADTFDVTNESNTTTSFVEQENKFKTQN